MQKIYYLLTGISCLLFTASNTYADNKAAMESASQKTSAISENLLDITVPEENFKEQLQEQRRLEIENSLIKARLERELADLRAEIERLRWQKEASALKWEIEQEEKVKMHEREVLSLNLQKDKLMASNALSQAQMAQLIEQFNLSTAELQNKSALLRIEAEKLRTEIDQNKAKQERNKYADGEPTYLPNPLRKDNTLVISDRCIKLNGPITPWLANYVTDRIQYFNNKDKNKPIFIVIDYSPGGSTASGHAILTAMENSQAPIHVVVKTFAASMAALITSLAKQSYAYPNALMLHHQPWTFAIGNLREIKEDLSRLQEIWKRLGGRLATKMGITLDNLDKKLYEKSANGDWLEFADHAHKIKWVDHIITGIEDTSSRELPNPENYNFQNYFKEYWSNIQTPENTPQSCNMYLPILGPKDFYYLYDPNKSYQIMAVK